MLNKLHPLSRYKANSGKKLKKLAKDTTCDKSSSVIFICLIPFCQL